MPMPKEIEGIHLSGFFPSLYLSKEIAERELAFSRGFTLIKNSTYFASEKELKSEFDFSVEYIGSTHHLLIQKKLECQSYKDNNFGVWLLGTACFTSDEMSTYDESIPEYLCSRLNNSPDDFFSALDSLSGTYAIIWTNFDVVNVVNDVHGLRSIFYSARTGNFSSHLELLNLTEREDLSEMQKHFKKLAYDYCYQFPGNLTSYSNLFFLTPNFFLNTKAIETKRFFPREKRTYTSLHEAKLRVLEKYSTVAKKYNKKYNLAMSLTGGRDSRVSLFSMLDMKDDIYFFSESRDDDLQHAKKIAKKYELNWLGFDPRIVDNSSNSSYEIFQRILQKSVFPKHVTWALKSQFLVFNFFGSKDFLHIHSNGAESARGRTADYEYAFLREEYCFDKFFEAYLRGCVAWLSNNQREQQFSRMLNDSFLRNYLKQYFDELDHNSFGELGFNPWDFMYIEHRTACFLSQVHVLNQATFESTSLSNSRDVLLDMWGIEDRHIIKSSILYNSILNEFDSGEKDKNFGLGYIDKNSIEPIAKELLYSGVYQIKSLVANNRWKECSVLIHQIFEIDPEVRYVYEHCFRVFVETKEFDSMIAYAKYIMSSSQLRKTINYSWIETVCNRLRSEGYNDVVHQLAKIFCVSDPSLHWAFKQMAHVTEKADKESALEYIKTAYILKSDDQWNSALYVRLLISFGKTNEILAVLKEISTIPEKKCWNFQILGRIYSELGLLGESKSWIDIGLNLYPNDPILIGLRDSLRT